MGTHEASRFLRVSLDGQQALRAWGTQQHNVHRAFVPDAPSGHADALLVQGLWLTSVNCSESVSLVTIGTQNDTTLDTKGERCVATDHHLVHPLHYRSSRCAPNAPQLDRYSRAAPWTPRCLVVLLEAPSRRDLLETLVADGRDLTLPLVVHLEATGALGQEALAAVHADLSVLLQDASRRDLVDADRHAALAAAAAEETHTRAQADLVAATLDGLVHVDAPMQQRVVDLEAAAVAARDAHAKLAEEVRGEGACDPNMQICGQPHAHDPWTSEDGERCRGASSFSLLPGDVCLRLDQLRNPDAELPSVQHEQFTDAPATCLSEDNQTLRCPPHASLTTRAGIFELEYLARRDRSDVYCQRHIFQQAMLDEPNASSARCAEQLETQLSNCSGALCPRCVLNCSSATARSISSAWKCSGGYQGASFAMAAFGSDAGEHARFLHGAVRVDNTQPVPEALAEHLFRVVVNNPSGRIARDAVSCRAHHRLSSRGHFVHAFDDDGVPVARTGFMMQCEKDADCVRSCPRHPKTGLHYVCQRYVDLYDSVHTGDGSIRFLNLTDGDGDAFDVLPGQGVCVDVRYDLLVSSCDSHTGFKVMQGLLGCSQNLFGGANCGLALAAPSGSELDDAELIDEGFPRTLRHATDSAPAVQCSSVHDCKLQCRVLDRAGPLGAPPQCALCNPFCPSNPVSSIVNLVSGLVADIQTAVKLLGRCVGDVGFGGCICSMVMLLEPHWRRVTTNEKARCTDGNAFGQLASRIGDLALDLVEDGANQLVIRPANSILYPIVNPGKSAASLGAEKISLTPEQYDAYRAYIDKYNEEIRAGATHDEARATAEAYVADQAAESRSPEARRLENNGDPIPFFCFDRSDGTKGQMPWCSDDANLAAFEHLKLLLGGHIQEANATNDGYETRDPLDCMDSSQGLQNLCLYRRIYEVCSSQTRHEEYVGLFDTTNADAARLAFVEAFSESLLEQDPLLQRMIEGVRASANTINNLDARDICSGSSFASALSLEELIESCLFAVVEQSCPGGATEFRDELEDAEWTLPDVRLFDDTIDPPPPPPVSRDVLFNIEAEDPRGVQLANERLHDAFPKLGDVAKGTHAATIGDFAPSEVTSAQLTAALLATHGMHGGIDGLGARIVQAFHTGFIRRACATLASQAGLDPAPSGSEENPAPWHRTILAYQLLMVDQALEQEHVSLKDSWDDLCGDINGFHHATDVDKWHSYGIPDGARLENFWPLVGIGTLDELRRVGEASCSEETTDFSTRLACGMIGNSEGVTGGTLAALPEMHQDSPAATQRRLCDPELEPSVEQAIGLPEPFQKGLVDSKTSAMRSPFFDVIVPASMRGDELTRKQGFSVQGWVLLTVEADGYKPGFHRIMELPVFDTRECASLPFAGCGEYDTGMTGWATSFEGGREMLPRVRCWTPMRDVTGVDCVPDPFPGQCGNEKPVLVERPYVFASTHWLPHLSNPPPPPPLPPPTPPPPSPPPLPPPGAPPPPMLLSWPEVRELAHAAQAEICSTVYVRGVQERCDLFAVKIAQTIVYTSASLPAPPPEAPPSSPQPLPPPSPPAAALVAPTGWQMTTYRMPEAAAEPRAEADGYEVSASTRTAIENQLHDALSTKLLPLKCLDQGDLPCATGVDTVDDCRDGQVPCTTVQPPAIELEFELPRGSFFSGLNIELPQSEELARFFFSYQVRVFDASSEVLCELNRNNAEIDAPPQDRVVELHCPLERDDTVQRLERAKRVRIETTNRLWLHGVQLQSRDVRDALRR